MSCQLTLQLIAVSCQHTVRASKAQPSVGSRTDTVILMIAWPLGVRDEAAHECADAIAALAALQSKHKLSRHCHLSANQVSNNTSAVTARVDAMMSCHVEGFERYRWIQTETGSSFVWLHVVQDAAQAQMLLPALKCMQCCSS